MLNRRLSCIFLLVQAAAHAQTSNVTLPTHALGSDDLLSLSVYGVPELTRTFRVGGDGQLGLPMLKNPVQAQGLLPGELEIAIAKALWTDRILVKPIVSVTVVEYASRPITVLGAVRKPLTFQALGGVTLLEALARAEGLSQDAGPDIVFTRPSAGAGSNGGLPPEIIHIPVRGLMVEANPELNYKLYGGEQIRVPDAGRVFVIGNVRRPGAFVFKDPADATVLKVLAQAEGLTAFAQSEAIVYRRDRQSGERTEASIPLRKILQRKAPDQQLGADDVLFIPEAKGKRLTASAFDRIISFGSSTASVAVWRF